MRSDSPAGPPRENPDRREAEDGQRDPGRGPGHIAVVSLGPGAPAYLAPRAREAVLAAEVLVGYKTYLRLMGDLAEGKTVFASGMQKEIARCRTAIDQARAGRRVALVSSGDAGIYGMAGLVLDLCRELGLRVAGAGPGAGPDAGPGVDVNAAAPRDREADIELEIIPGIAAFNAAASLAGAPLMHDFAAVSLSDHLTPWDLIEKRLIAAASADFVVALYNPRSKTRPHLLAAARELLLRHLPRHTPVAVVGRAMRDGQWMRLSTLEDLPIEDVDMQTVIIVGNSRTYLWDGWMITPRGYFDKYSALAEADEAEDGQL